MAITDPEAIKFVNEYIRPMCENVRYMNARGQDFAIKWASIGSDFPNDPSEIVEDNRESQGVSRLTGADINAVAVVFSQLISDLSGITASSVISKPCVRPLMYTPDTTI
jgi:hypothetical protein